MFRINLHIESKKWNSPFQDGTIFGAGHTGNY